jgi:hypothetical protein
MNYPSEFSDSGRAAVEAALILERREHQKRKREWKSNWAFDEERSLETFVLKVFSAYGSEVTKVGQNGLWTVDQMRKQGEEGLRLIVIEVNHQTGNSGQFMDGPYLSTNAKSKFRETEEWLDFEDGLLEIAGKHTANKEATQAETPSSPKIRTAGNALQNAVESGKRSDGTQANTVPADQANNGPERPRGQHGPKRDYETAARVDAIVTRIAGSDPWKSKLDDICDGLDDEDIARPKTWITRDPPIRNWTDAAVTDPELARKAIEHHLKNARR